MSSVLPHLKKVPLFETLTEEELKKIEQISSKAGYQQEHVLFHEGDQGDIFYIILIGSVKIYSEQNGKEKIITILKKGDSFGELSLIDNQPRSASAQTLENTVLLFISKSSFMTLLQSNFSVTQKILEELSARLRKTNTHVTDLVFNDAKANVVKALIQLSIDHGKRTNDIIEVNAKIGNGDISKISGISEEVVDYVLKDFENKNILTYHNQKIVLNLFNFKQMKGTR